MADQNLVAGDAPYPEYLSVDEVPIEGNASPVSFAKGELATIDANGFLVKMTTTRINGLVQVRAAVTGGLAGDDSVLASVNNGRSRILVPLPINAHKGQLVQINGSDGTGNAVVSAATVDTANLGIGRIFELYLNAALKSAAADLGVVDLGLY
jgi:hypothetical protein